MESLQELRQPLLRKEWGDAPGVWDGGQEKAGFFSWKSFSQSPFPQPELTQQLLNVGTLQRTVQPYCTLEPALYQDPSAVEIWGAPTWKRRDCTETAFMDADSELMEGSDRGDAGKKLMAEKDIHTVSYDVGEVACQNSRRIPPVTVTVRRVHFPWSSPRITLDYLSSPCSAAFGLWALLPFTCLRRQTRHWPKEITREPVQPPVTPSS
ncbi:uncharacterized protein LOC115480450 [Microcaecilia unicolor]|uniref:Uncharacterized protein LOC115480450 n=1 Tax=Microcaecilia unicolor TaxID=1415580 RepID=A0A6P7Z6L5_9AMPH|nr:uncharacterized protein LOC115480450 [Microcaecilia unicolor]